MNDITILIWLVTGSAIGGLAIIVYLILRWIAKRDVENAFQEKQALLDQQYQKIEDKEKWYKKYVADSNAMLINKKNEALVKEKQTKEMLVNGEKIREELQQKIDQLTLENSKLRNDLIAARQRAKRLATKLETAG